MSSISRGGPIAAWDRFFFSPSDPTPLGLIRITTGLLLLWSLGCMGLDLRAFLGSTGWDDPEIIQLIAHNRESWEWSFWFWVPDGGLWMVWGLCMGVWPCSR